MAKTQKPRRPRAQTPKGFRDYFGAEVTTRKAMLDTIAGIYHLYGFEALESSAVETVESLGKFLPDVDRPNAGVFAFRESVEEDADADWLALRYDLTAPLARVYAQHRNELPTPYRRYAMGPVWRNEKPGPGRFRQFYQCDADTVGTGSVAADAEICAMLCDTLEAVGIERGDYVVKVNNRKVLDGVLEVAGLAGDEKAAERGIVLRAIDKMDRLGVEGVRALLGAGRRDESGDFTEGAGLDENSIQLVMKFADAKRELQTHLSQKAVHSGESGKDAEGALRALLDEPSFNEIDAETGLADPMIDAKRLNGAWLDYFAKLLGSEEHEGVTELFDIVQLCNKQGYGPDRIVIDPSVVRGLGYYTGPVFEAELTFETLDEKGRPQRFGSVAGGGRYDDLVTRFTGQAVPATGVSIGVDRLLAALAAKGRVAGDAAGPVIVTVMDRERMADYQRICAGLRQAGIRAEVYLGNPKNFGNQLKYADRRGSPFAVIQGTDEAARGVVQVKDLVLGAELSQEASLEEWKENPSQTEVAEADLVAFLKGRLP